MEQLRLRAADSGYDSASLDEMVTVSGPAALERMLESENYNAVGRTGVGTPADVPWIAVVHRDTPLSAQSGAYLVYPLFQTHDCPRT